VRHVKFSDEMFVLNPAHVEGLCNGILERGLSLNIWCYARVDSLRPGWAQLLKRAGVNWLAFGIETADTEVGRDVNKGFSRDDVRAVIKRVRDAGINVIGNYIFGLPEDDQASMQATLDMATELNCEFANFYSTMAYPGSPLYGQAIANGWGLPPSWSGYSQHAVDTLPLPTKHISAAEVLRFRDRAFDIYFRNPRYLEMVERTFGPATVEHIRQMTSHTLVRNHA
jgi:radical SAM superfamily enzyme YgiQ (UPF0313 family)